MKKIILSSAFIFAAAVLTNAQQLKITNYENNTVSYGTIEKGSEGKRVIKIENTGDKPLIISNIRSTCGCTVPSWTSTPIAPGKKGEIVVTYNTSIVGNFNKNIVVTSNDIKNPTFSVTVEGSVK